MSKLLLVAALAALGAAAPYPPEVAEPVKIPAVKPFFGHKDGNFQPTKTVPEDGTAVIFAKGQYQSLRN